MKRTERVPVIPQVFGCAAIFNDVPLASYLQDGRLLAECQINTMEAYGYDATFAMMDVNVEAEAMGADVVYREQDYPFIKNRFLDADQGTARLDVPDPQQDGRMPEMIEAIRLMRRDIGDGTLVTSALLGPFTLTCQILGTERALYLLADDRPRFLDYLDFATSVAISYGSAQVKAGSHVPIIFDPAASPAVLPPALFRELEVPPLAKLNQVLLGAGAAGTWLHVAGPTTNILPFFAEIGVSVANFDYDVTPENAMRSLPGTCLDGNVKSLSFCLGSPEEMREHCDQLQNIFADRGGFILSSGCEIPLEANPDCIRAMVESARER